MDGAKAGAHGDLSDDSPARVSINSPAFAQDAKGRATRHTGGKSGNVIEKSRPNIGRLKNTEMSDEGREAQCLFQYHFAGQMTGNYFSEFVAPLSRLDHGFTRTVEFG